MLGQFKFDLFLNSNIHIIKLTLILQLYSFLIFSFLLFKIVKKLTTIKMIKHLVFISQVQEEKDKMTKKQSMKKKNITRPVCFSEISLSVVLML